MREMSGKTCLVTGATSGIGKGTALRLAMLGATVIIAARDPARGAAAGHSARSCGSPCASSPAPRPAPRPLFTPPAPPR